MSHLVVTPRTRRSALVVFVRCAATGAPLGGAVVQLRSEAPAFNRQLELMERQHGGAWEGLSSRPDRATSAPDGAAIFGALPPATYSVEARLPRAGSRYGAAGATVEVTTGGDGGGQPSQVELALPPTCLTGRVVDSVGPLAQAQVWITDGGEHRRTDGEGRFTFVGVEPGGARPLSVLVRGETVVKAQAELIRGQTTSVELVSSVSRA